MKKFIALAILTMCSSAYSSTLDSFWDTEEGKRSIEEWKTEKIEIHKTRCAKVGKKLDECIHDKEYKGKFTLSITNPPEEDRFEVGPDFYAEIINGESEKITLTDAEAKIIRNNIYEYIRGIGINGKLKIDYMGNQLFNGWWTTTSY